MKNTISLCMIVKNEIKNLKTLLLQVLPVIEEIVVVDTGSTDGTLQLLQHMSAEYQNLKLHQFEWIDDFSAARNFSYSLATQEFVLYLDGDDQVNTDELRRFKEECLIREDVDCWLLNYVYSSTSDGIPQLVLTRERFIRRNKNPVWTGAIHESIPFYHLKHELSNILTIHHHRDKCGKTFDYDRNKRILAKEFSKNQNDARTAFYYGKELFDAVDPDGIPILEHYLTLPGKYVDDHVGALFRLAKHYLVKKDHRKSLDYAYEIYHIEHDRQRAEIYWIFGAVEQDLGNFKVAIEWFQRCLNCKPNPMRVIPEEYYTWHPCRRISECYRAIGDHISAIFWAKKYLNMLPNDIWANEYYKSMFVTLQPFNNATNQVIVECHSKQLRQDSHKLDTLDHLSPESVDGIVVETPVVEDVNRVLKPGGWVWVVNGHLHLDNMQFLDSLELGCCDVIRKYIKINESLPRLHFQSSPNIEYGPYRIRIHNLKLSAINMGYKISDKSSADYLIGFSSPLWKENDTQRTVIDICEKLPSYAINFDEVDMISVCSPMLKEHLKTITNKPVFVVHDHYEYMDGEWL